METDDLEGALDDARLAIAAGDYDGAELALLAAISSLRKQRQEVEQ